MMYAAPHVGFWLLLRQLFQLLLRSVRTPGCISAGMLLLNLHTYLEAARMQAESTSSRGPLNRQSTTV